MISFKTGFKIAAKSFVIIKQHPILLLYPICFLLIIFPIMQYAPDLITAIIPRGFLSTIFFISLLTAIPAFFGMLYGLLITYHSARCLGLYSGTFLGDLKKKIGKIICWPLLVGLFMALVSFLFLFPSLYHYYPGGGSPAEVIVIMIFFRSLIGILLISFTILFIYVWPIILLEHINILNAMQLSIKVALRTFMGLLGSLALIVPIVILLNLFVQIIDPLKQYNWLTLIWALIGAIPILAFFISILLLYLEYKKVPQKV